MMNNWGLAQFLRASGIESLAIQGFFRALMRFGEWIVQSNDRVIGKLDLDEERNVGFYRIRGEENLRWEWR